jgi:hypothetical protein
VITACFHGGPWDDLQLQLTMGYACYCFQAHRPKNPVTELPIMGMHGPQLPTGVETEFYVPSQAIGTRVCYRHIGRRWMGGVPR